MKLNANPNRAALGFSCLGHLYMHFATAMFYTMALALEKEWQMPFHEVNELWVIGAALVGIAAVPAGILGDRWSARGMMSVFLIGIGGAVMVCGFMDDPKLMLLGLAGIGLFGAIYHPIGIPWLIANSGENKGFLLAVNGMFGGAGPALAGLVTGFLIDQLGWQYAFFLPGAVILLTGFTMVFYLVMGWLPATGLASKQESRQSRGDVVRVFGVLLLTMFAGGIIYHTTQAVLPKLFTLRWTEFVEGTASRAGLLVFFVYLTGAVMQLAGGILADRFPLRKVYAIGWFLQILILSAIASATGFNLFLVVLLLASANTGVLPAENMLLYRFTPARYKGLAFGLKFILAFGAAPAGLYLNSMMQGTSGGYTGLFWVLACAAAIAFLVSILLPGEREQQSASMPAE